MINDNLDMSSEKSEIINIYDNKQITKQVYNMLNKSITHK